MSKIKLVNCSLISQALDYFIEKFILNKVKQTSTRVYIIYTIIL